MKLLIYCLFVVMFGSFSIGQNIDDPTILTYINIILVIANFGIVINQARILQKERLIRY